MSPILFTCICLLAIIECFTTVHGQSSDSTHLDTYLSPLVFEGITYNKRAKNASRPASVAFHVRDISEPETLSLSWLYNDENLDSYLMKEDQSVPKYAVAYHTIKQSPGLMTVVLHLKNGGLKAGRYTLKLSRQSEVLKTFSSNVTSSPILPTFQKTKRVLQGDTLRLFCHVQGYPLPEMVAWSFSPIPSSQSDDNAAIALAKNQLVTMNTTSSHYVWTTSSGGVTNDTLEFSKLLESDNGLYACNVTTSLGSDFTLILVNVKDRWAALWPFIGIVIEVSILVTAILLYERHQLRSKPSSSSDGKADGAAGEVGRAAGVTETCSPPVAKLNQQQQAQPFSQNVNNMNAAGGDTTTDGLLSNGPTNADRDSKVEEVRNRSGKD